MTSRCSPESGRQWHRQPQQTETRTVCIWQPGAERRRKVQTFKYVCFHSNDFTPDLFIFQKNWSSENNLHHHYGL